jgi:transposase-like protein
MPWMETDPMQERKRFVNEAKGGLFSFSELCRRHGVSRKTGYKWVERYELEGRTAWPITPTGPAPALMRPTLSCWKPRSSSGVADRAGGRGRSSAIWPSSIQTGRSPRPRPCISTSSAVGWSRREGGARGAPIPGGLPPSSIDRTRSGRQTSRANSKRSTVSTAIRSPFRTARAALSWPAKAWTGPHTPAHAQSSRGCSRNSACPSGSAPTTERRSRPALWAASRDSRSGGSSSGSCPT